ncbi:CBS domain-containing protein [Anaerobacillus alkaliphilus]|uniref:CBS domain-containing protein n=1 Tax=Anaerobacillus alkaliphilus TaxID=1548597 RepID=A0A4Q0VTY4_9BACI|nr:CBS domain-containing protein [Anaerobacillus alkaliphilus]RXJ01768.1 CBS domain-containing protein [Anaerobacillus alkaliphilus]
MAQSINEIMTKNVVCVTPQQSIQECAQLMKQHNIGVIPVVENGQLQGIVTDRDITIRSTADGIGPNTPVSQCMTNNVTTASSTMDVHEVANIMAQQQIRRLPVVDNNQLVGMVAIGDLAETDIYQNEAGEALASISTPAEPDQLRQ